MTLILDLLFSIAILSISFTIFTHLVHDYKVLITISKLVKKTLRTSFSKVIELYLPITILVKNIDIVDIRSEDVNLKFSIKNSKIVLELSTLKSIINLLVTLKVYGKLDDYLLTRKVLLVFH